MKPKFLIAASASVALLAVVAAFAAEQNPEQKDAVRALARACRPDAERLCSNVEQGGGRKLMCLRSHAAELRPACKDGLAKAQALHKGGALPP